MVSLTYQIRPTRLEAFEARSKYLLLEAGMGKLSVLLWDKSRSAPEAAEVFSGIASWEEDWEWIRQQSELLGFKGVEAVAFLNYPRFLPVPQVFYKPSDAIIQMEALFGEAAYLHTGGDILPGMDMVIGWQAPKNVFEDLADHFDSVQFRSVATLLVQNGMDLPEDTTTGHLLVSGTLVWLTVWRHKQLLIVKSIMADDGENIAYQLLNICRQWGIEPGNMHWKVSGLVNADSPLWHAVARFFEHFEPQQAGIAFAADIPAHYFAHQIQFLAKATTN